MWYDSPEVCGRLRELFGRLSPPRAELDDLDLADLHHMNATSMPVGHASNGSNGSNGYTAGRDGPDSQIELLAFQDAKRMMATRSSTEGDLNSTNRTRGCAVVAHGVAGSQRGGFADIPSRGPGSVHALLARRMSGVSEKEVAAAEVGSKAIRWTTAQLIRPMEAVVEDPPMAPDPIWQVMTGGIGGEVGEKGRGPILLVAGDLMTQSRFVAGHHPNLDLNTPTPTPIPIPIPTPTPIPTQLPWLRGECQRGSAHYHDARCAEVTPPRATLWLLRSPPSTLNTS